MTPSFKNTFNWPLWHWHFEVSSICTLGCPRCPRNELPETLVQKQLRLDFFEKNFNLPGIIKKITFCGDDGDPIYARDLIPIIKFLKKNDPLTSITIITNGSYKSPDWWKELGSALNSHDQVRFSLDGWDQESNEKYRINCDWESIVAGIRSIRQSTDAILWWDAIAFRFNENNIDTMKQMATELQFDNFQLTKSTKFGKKYKNYLDNNGNDDLEPSEKYISKSHRFERDIVEISGRKIDESNILKENLKYYHSTKKKFNEGNIIPLCFIGTKGLFVNSQGYLIPCCWVGNRYNHTGLKQFMVPENNIHIHGLEKVLNNSHWNSFIESFHEMKECKSKCVANLVDEKYATEW